MISDTELRQIVDNVVFPGEEVIVKSKKLARLPKYERKEILLSSSSEETTIVAAIEIQRVWRGFVTRCRIVELVYAKASIEARYDGSRLQLADQGLGDVSSPEPTPETEPKKRQTIEQRGRSKLEQRYKIYIDDIIAKTPPGDQSTPPTFQDFCALFIQSWWSNYSSLSFAVSLDGHPPPPNTAFDVATPVRTKSVVDPERSAALKIQKAWRRHIDIQVYRYYRDLINFRQRGDPSLMLKCINPNEARLLDAAAGNKIRFRLAGDRFPPNIYYKIFTHRNIVDMCANSPKDYTAASVKRPVAKHVNNKTPDPLPDDGSRWYRRIENNGWRLVSDRLILRADQDQVTYETSRKQLAFPHSRPLRREDVERRRKRKKIEWMKKMYNEGSLEVNTDNAEKRLLVNETTHGMLATVDRYGYDIVHDWEVDKLLEWTNGLNFDHYLDDWKCVATTASSDKDQVFLQRNDPYEFSVASATMIAKP